LAWDKTGSGRPNQGLSFRNTGCFPAIQLFGRLGFIGRQPPARISGKGNAWVAGASRGQGVSRPSLPVLTESRRAIQAQTFPAGGFGLGNLKGLANGIAVTFFKSAFASFNKLFVALYKFFSFSFVVYLHLSGHCIPHLKVLILKIK
jgi:hypothetical protein